MVTTTATNNNTCIYLEANVAELGGRGNRWHEEAGVDGVAEGVESLLRESDALSATIAMQYHHVQFEALFLVRKHTWKYHTYLFRVVSHLLRTRFDFL